MCLCCYCTGLRLTPSFSGYDDALLDDHYDALGFDPEFAEWDSGSDN